MKTEEVLGYSRRIGWSIVLDLRFMVFVFLKPKPARDLESLEVGWK